MFTVFISAGSNVGDRKNNINRSLEKISGRCVIYSVSSIYETEPVGNPDQPYFLNTIFEIGTTMLPHCLLRFLKRIEIDMGREKKKRWGPRIIDLDIIFYGNSVIETSGLTIPHPDTHKRKFVLEPLCELYPELIHPLLNKPVKTIFKELDSNKKTRKIR